MKNTITQNANSMHVSWNSTNAALEQRISETRVARNNLDTHLAKTNQEIKDQEKEINTLTKALRDKEAPLKVLVEILRSMYDEFMCHLALILYITSMALNKNKLCV